MNASAVLPLTRSIRQDITQGLHAEVEVVRGVVAEHFVFAGVFAGFHRFADLHQELGGAAEGEEQRFDVFTGVDAGGNRVFIELLVAAERLLQLLQAFLGLLLLFVVGVDAEQQLHHQVVRRIGVLFLVGLHRREIAVFDGEKEDAEILGGDQHRGEIGLLAGEKAVDGGLDRVGLAHGRSLGLVLRITV
ncbi:MAG: hypothetical protein RL095_1216 [Verrucomicrobiota bacterium]